MPVNPLSLQPQAPDSLTAWHSDYYDVCADPGGCSTCFNTGAFRYNSVAALLAKEELGDANAPLMYSPCDIKSIIQLRRAIAKKYRVHDDQDDGSDNPPFAQCSSSMCILKWVLCIGLGVFPYGLCCITFIPDVRVFSLFCPIRRPLALAPSPARASPAKTVYRFPNCESRARGEAGAGAHGLFSSAAAPAHAARDGVNPAMYTRSLLP